MYSFCYTFRKIIGSMKNTMLTKLFMQFRTLLSHFPYIFFLGKMENFISTSLTNSSEYHLKKPLWKIFSFNLENECEQNHSSRVQKCN